MEKRQSKRKLLGQNFLKDERLVARLVSLRSIDPEDVRYEIGPGLGIITAELARYAKKVIAIERDPALVSRLRLRFSCVPNVEIVAGDFLRYRIRLGTGYKVFASVPL